MKKSINSVLFYKILGYGLHNAINQVYNILNNFILTIHF